MNELFCTANVFVFFNYYFLFYFLRRLSARPNF